MFHFTMTGKAYSTDLETLETLRSIVPSAKRTGDNTGVAAMMFLGLKVGRIRLIVGQS